MEDVLDKETMLLDFIKLVKVKALEHLEKGGQLLRHKLVRKRASRKWKDEAVIERVFASSLQDELYIKKIKSPAQLEKLVGKKEVSEYTVIPETGVTIAHKSDKRAEVISNVDFETVTNKKMKCEA